MQCASKSPSVKYFFKQTVQAVNSQNAHATGLRNWTVNFSQQIVQSDILVGGLSVGEPARFNFTGQLLQKSSSRVLISQKHFWHRIVHKYAV